MTPAVAASPLTRPGEVLLAVRHLTKTFHGAEGVLPVLDDIDFEVRAGEIVALLGRSGSGKSTLLRCLAGLVAPTSGTVERRGEPLREANPGASMVFQSFALLPWLTVQQNVELGLEARGVSRVDRARAAVEAIDLIGLDGFESAYPKELSGGMRQRVGFARAVVIGPEVLLMDEPFSALDVLTAENLRGELLEIWERGDIPIQAIVIVTHNIEEAVLLADRIVVLSANPGRIKATVPVGLPRPRDRRATKFEGLVATLYSIMTGHEQPRPAGTVDVTEPRRLATLPMPNASVDGLSGLAEIIHRLGRTSIADLAADLILEVDDLLPLIDALELLGFAEITDGRLSLTEAGSTFASADIQASKQIFATAAQAAPLIGTIEHSLARTTDGTLRAGFFLDLLRRHFSADEAATQLATATDWGRYAELFEYDADHDELHLERPPPRTDATA